MIQKILLVAGTRPNFIKLAPLYHQLKSKPQLDIKICHTGQHFDYNMSDVFWQCLEIPKPDFALNVSGGNVPEIIGKTLIEISKVLQAERFDAVIVFGDVNATVAGAIAGAQSGLKVMHVESGLRSRDRAMPEEVNRVITDHISDVLFVSEQSGLENLAQEGIDPAKIFFTGNIMIETLLRTQAVWEKVELSPEVKSFTQSPFAIATFHRPENVDQQEPLSKVVNIIKIVAEKTKVILPLHPRTKSRLESFGMLTELQQNQQILLTSPLPYFDFLKLLSLSEFVFTDSGGVQEEASHLNKACITFRKNTERPSTIILGTNQLQNIHDSNFLELMLQHIQKVKASTTSPQIPFWDNKVSERIVQVIESLK